MERSAVLARTFLDAGSAVADEVVDRLKARGLASVSAMIARSLVSALAQAIEDASPDAVISWARMARGAYSVGAIRDALAITSEIAAEHGEHADHGFSALLDFLENVKTNVAEAFPPASGRRNDERHRAANGMIEGVLAMLKAHDETTCTHAYATGAWCKRLAEAMNLGEGQTDLIVRAGILHDIGKIGTPDAILFKPGLLTYDEWTVMQRHAEFGARILSELPALARYAPIVRAHHERWDGQGYPNALKGDEIPFEARVVAVADAFHAMISVRPYRPAIAQRNAMAILRDGRGTQWDATIVDAMIQMLEAPQANAKRQAARG